MPKNEIAIAMAAKSKKENSRQLCHREHRLRRRQRQLIKTVWQANLGLKKKTGSTPQPHTHTPLQAAHFLKVQVNLQKRNLI